jgi:hypothetical protein
MTTAFVKELYNEDLVYSSVVFGMGFWIDDQGLFISAPEFKDGSLDIDNTRVRLGELERTYPAPLVSLNACESNVYTQERHTANRLLFNTFHKGVQKCINQTELTFNLPRVSLTISMKLS